MPNQYRTGYVATVQEGADLTVSISPEGDWEVYYRPSDAAIEIARDTDPDFSIPSDPILLVKGSPKSDTIITYPLNTTATSPGFLTPKYERLRTITFEGAVGPGFRRKPLAACAFDPSRLFAGEPTRAKSHDARASASISSGRWRISLDRPQGSTVGSVLIRRVRCCP
jgi:hypothetical protein